MRRLGFLRMLVPPAIVPLALWVFVALAGPGGAIEFGDDTQPPSPAVGEGSDDGTDGTDVDGGGGTDGDGADDVVAESHENGSGCEQALTEQAQSQTELEEHVADADTPAGGAAGNQNALDHQCGGAFADGGQDGTTEPADEAGTGPGKSEDSSGNSGGGNANGGGQTNADDGGQGAADAPGHNKP